MNKKILILVIGILILVSLISFYFFKDKVAEVYTGLTAPEVGDVELMASGSCSGTATACIIFQQAACGTIGTPQYGCYWFSFCAGIATACVNLLTQGECENQLGCSWTEDAPAVDNCNYTKNFHWVVNESCGIVGQNVNVSGNITIQNNGDLNLSSGTNITFNSTGQYIFVNTGGEINIFGGSGFNS